MTNKTSSKIVKTVVKIPQERIKDLLIGAFEGSSKHWYCIQDRTKNSDLYVDEPFIVGGFILIDDSMADDPTLALPIKLDFERLEIGLAVFAEKEPRHFGDFISENDDAVTADVFLQCCVFGEVIYG